MSDDAEAPVVADRQGYAQRFRVYSRSLAWPLFNIYGIGLNILAWGILILLTFAFPPRVPLAPFVFLVLLSTTVRQLGFPIGGLTNSLFGIVDITTLLLLGPIAAAWQSAISVLLHTGLNFLRRTTRTPWNTFKFPIFNASLKILMALIGGWLYIGLGGVLAPPYLHSSLIVPGAVLCVVWFAIDYMGWGMLQLLSGGRTRLLQWTRYTATTALLVELMPLPFAFLFAAIGVSQGATDFVMFALAIVLSSLAVNLMASARSRLEKRVAELTTLNHVSEEIIRSSNSEQATCDLIYRFASQVVDTTYFLLGLIEDGGKTENLVILVAQGERQPPRTLPIGGVVSWMQQNQRPLVVRDLQHESLPFAPRQLGSDASLVRSALFVPMLAGPVLIGFMSIQSQLPAAFTEDDTRILAAMANQAGMAIANIRLQRQAAARERMERELHLARDIQRSLLPSSCPTLPTFELAADWKSAREVSGDFYDFLPLHHGKLGIIVADVSDKGVPAALFMALSRSLVRSGLLGANSPAEGMRRANRWIIKDTTSDMFLTLFYAVLDPATNLMTYVNAGHNPPLLIRQHGEECKYLDEHGIALGIQESANYTESVVAMQAGDVLLMYTDGVTEAMNPAGELFGEERLRQVATAHHSETPANLVAVINEAVKAFVGDQPANDDATLIVARRKENGAIDISA